MLAAWGRSIHRFRAWVLAISAVVFVASLVLVVRGGTLASPTIPDTESDRGQHLLERELGQPGAASFIVIFEADRALDDDAMRADVEAALAPLQRAPNVARVLTPWSVPGVMAPLFRAQNGRSVVAQVALSDDIQSATRRYTSLRAMVRPRVTHAIFTGNLAYKEDLDRTLEVDLRRGELVSVPLALIVLLLVFGSLAAASLPVGVGGVAVLSGMACVFVSSRFMNVTQYSLNVTSLIGTGVAIDYSLFIVNRFRDELAAGKDTPDALAKTLSTAGRAVLFSGVAVAIGLSGLLFYKGTFLSSMGVAGALVVALSVLFALTLLPALLSYLGPRVNAGRIPFAHLSGDEGRWRRVATWVMKRPLAVLIPTLAFALVAGVPFGRLQLAAASVRVLPTRVEARHGYEVLRAQFPSLVSNRITVVAQIPEGQSLLESERVGTFYDYSRRIARIRGVSRVDSFVDLDPTISRQNYQDVWSTNELFRPPQWNEALGVLSSPRVVAFVVTTSHEVHTPEARAIVSALRAERSIAGTELVVTGQTALDLDTTAYILSHTPKAVGFVMGMTFIVLFLLLGSVVLPLKAVLMNLLSISASFGALVFIFQDGHLRSLLRFEPGPIEPALPVVLFCAVFGLSMDYEVLMLTRMQEEYLRSRDNTRAVAEGLERSGRLVTSAAAIMVAVFSAFALAEVVILKAVGVGMALAVALDASLVRILIVPATMRLFGDLNWWAPKPLASLYRKLRIHHHEDD